MASRVPEPRKQWRGDLAAWVPYMRGVGRRMNLQLTHVTCLG